jgi:hypothetical protein
VILIRHGKLPCNEIARLAGRVDGDAGQSQKACDGVQPRVRMMPVPVYAGPWRE